ncbi:hypothetical protein [Hymenobacter sp.]|uniref:hypothetical protein n=1 Tax=Hymenobacter sp. TaxID=1898978 RepID=UPI00286BFC7B|nr:hypothetical protein [Hymenobacter sp.]
MNFLANSFQPAAGAAGVVSRVQLPTAGRENILHPELCGGKALPLMPPATARPPQGGALAKHRAQHRAQCRANCMSKANF